jgi:hypothetical protein
MEAELESEREHKEALAGEVAGMRAEMGALRDALGDLRSGTNERDAKVLAQARRSAGGARVLVEESPGAEQARGRAGSQVQRLTHRTLELLRELEEANARTSQAQDASVLLTDELSAARGEGAALVKKLAAAERAAAAAQGEAAAAARECAALRKQSEAAQERAAEFKAVAVAAEESGAALEARAEAAERDAAAQRTAALETAREAELLRLRVATLEASRPGSRAAASASSSTAAAANSETPRVLRRAPSSGAHEGASYASPTHSQSPRKSPGRGEHGSTGALAVSRAAPAPAQEVLVELAALERRAEGAEGRANKVSAAQPCCALARAPCHALTAGGRRWGRSVRARRRWRRPRSCWARSCRRWRTRRVRRAARGRSSCGGSPRLRARFAWSSLLTTLGTTVGLPHLPSRRSGFVMQRS